MAHRHRAQGGRSSMKGRESFVSAPSEREAKSTKDSFKRGGRHVGKAHGHKSKPRADRRARGGGVTHSPFSSAAIGNDMKRHPSNKDGHQPRADGGGVGAFKHGGRAKRHAGIGGTHSGGKHRPDERTKHEYNYGHHNGSGHEEHLERHMPVHHKHGGHAHGHSDGKKVHHAGHGAHHAHHEHHDGHHHGHHSGHHLHGSHKAKGRKHRAEGGKVDKEGD